MSRTVNAIIAAVACVWTAGCKTWNLPAYEEPVTMGAGGLSGRIAIVYHPGGSAFSERIVTELGEELVSRAYVVTLSTVNPELFFDQDGSDALVLGSPVYGAEVHPPIQEFITANAPFSVPVFAVLTGLFETAFYDENDLPNLTRVLDKAGVSLAGAIKIGTCSSTRVIEERIASLCDAIDATLHGN